MIRLPQMNASNSGSVYLLAPDPRISSAHVVNISAYGIPAVPVAPLYRFKLYPAFTGSATVFGK